MIKLIRIILLLAALFILNQLNTSAAEIHGQAQPFTLTGMDGKSYSLDSYRGKPVLLNFWASWCGPCKMEAPDFVKIHEDYKDDLVILAINVTGSDSIPKANAFVREHGFNFPVLYDKNGSVSKAYNIVAIPTTFFVNSKGEIVDKIIGYGGNGLLDNKVKRLIEQGK